jgi:toxin-antitoxin system PIN domain toxin
VLLDANLLLYSVDEGSPHHVRCATWVSSAFVGQRRIALPWQTIGAFLRIATHPRVFARPLSAEGAWAAVEQWLAAPVCWIPAATDGTARILGDLVRRIDARGNLVTDAQLAALAIEHGLSVVSMDSDFARFPGLHWINPLAD